MVIAKKFPRDETSAFNRIMNACKRKTLAETACYAYPRGGETVTGPSIRLAECMAQNWGNIDFGIVELEQKAGESQVMAYAWDLETNTRQTKIFTVKHERKAKGQIKQLDDPRDIYELTANQGARRLRACILGVIPGDVVESAVEACETTLKSGSKEPLIDRARKMVAAFGDYGVTQGMIESRLGHKLDAVSEQELVNLRKIFVSLKDGAAKREDFFKPEQLKPQFDAPTDDVPMDGPTPMAAESEFKKKEHAVNYPKGMRGLLSLAHISEAEFLDFARATYGWEDSLSSLDEVAMVAESKLAAAYDDWSNVLRAFNRAKNGGKK